MEDNQEVKENMFKTANDLRVNVTKSNGEVVIDEDCCTMVSIILKNTGDIAASFFGAHNPQVVRILEKSLKGYFKGIKKELKKNYLDESNEEIKVMSEEDIPDKDKWSGEEVPDLKEGSVPSKTPSAKVSPATKKSKEKVVEENTKTSKTSKKDA